MGDVTFFSIYTGLLSQKLASHQQGKAMGLTRTTATLMWSLTAFIGGLLIAWIPTGALLFAPLGVLILFFLINIFGEKT